MSSETGDLRYEVNDGRMDRIRAEYPVLDSIIKNAQYDGKAIKSEAWELFKALRAAQIVNSERPYPGNFASEDVTVDAWRQHHELLKRFTTEQYVRHDLLVVAHACDRTVSFGIAKGESLKRIWHSTQRNVGTMRELAQALLAACDFVESSNPEWAALWDENAT